MSWRGHVESVRRLEDYMTTNQQSARVLIVGTGKTADIISQYLRRARIQVLGYAETNPASSDHNGLPVYSLDGLESKVEQSVLLFVAIGSRLVNTSRQHIFESLRDDGWQFLTYVHPRATVADTATLGVNCIVMEENVIQDFVSIGDNNILWSGNHIGHHTSIGCHNFISSHVVISGNCVIGNNNFFGVNSSLGDGIAVGNYNWFSPMTSSIKDVGDEQLLLMPKPTIHRMPTLQFFKVPESDQNKDSL